MSGKGNCYDNATVETFFKAIKAEMIWRRLWPTRRSAKVALLDYINSILQSAPQILSPRLESPLAYERKTA
jgi:transposase InsO family protein